MPEPSPRRPPPPVIPFPDDRLPPQNLEAEEGVLGSIILEPEALDEVAVILQPEDFYRDIHQPIYRALRDLRDAGRPIDSIILADELIRRGEFDAIGGAETIAGLLAAVPHAANARYYAGIVQQKSVVRGLIAAHNAGLHDCYENAYTAEELMERGEQALFAVSDRIVGDRTLPLAEFAAGAMDAIVARSERRAPGVMSGLAGLDDMTRGLRPGQLAIIGARPSIGKTALGLQVAEHAAIGQGVSTLFVSLEMDGDELAERLIVGRARVPGQRVRSGARLDPDSPSRNVSQVAAVARRLRAREGLGLVVVDYLQLLDAAPDLRRKDRHEQVADISRRLKQLARDLRIPVLVLCQLNRKAEDRSDFEPRLADLRESGAIEQDADTVWLLHRPSFYRPDDRKGEADVIVAKQRNGPTGRVRLAFLPELTRFADLAPFAGDGPGPPLEADF
jgi:replicative DNA helicase